MSEAVEGSVVVVGGTNGLGLKVARHYADAGRDVVITGRDASRAQAVAEDIGSSVTGLALDLAEPDRIADSVTGIDRVAHVVLVAIERDPSTVKDYDVAAATRLLTLKLVGYTETIRALLPAMSEDSSIVLFGGSAKDRPYPGSTTVTTANGGIESMVRTLAVELAPMRINAIHPSPVGDNHFWKDKPAEVLEAMRSRTPMGRLVTEDDVVGGVVFLLENRGVNASNLDMNGGFLVT